ncbi:cysteine hydrolase family protein [Paeniglutamicibacter sulfureus]|uniref:Nicotinamidase-related amidase n=1 Tax=Paeniglutamicibacter sulfureus TaxID=43666 RepID=A0ABU2BNV9_9MICC|nr:isochorismatase family cysteine hydrolase [Paeniglutamicibacter sulfureus]MDR7360340.1 nicotinamidase-related amidase [Paeniglutamicibacter sulfureus]
MQEFPPLSERTALLIVDMQNAFFEDPMLARHRESLVRNCNELSRLARSTGMPIFNIRTEHARDKTTWTLSMLDDDQGFLFEGSEQAQNLKGLDVEDSQEILKRRDSAFWRTDLSEQLGRRGVEYVIVTGVSSHTCIASTAADAYADDLRVWLVSDAIASSDPDFEKSTLGLLQAEYRQHIITTESLLAAHEGHLAKQVQGHGTK